jgi:hypothetical protein
MLFDPATVEAFRVLTGRIAALEAMHDAEGVRRLEREWERGILA